MDYENMYFSKVEMSQTVPTGNCYIPDPYAAYADSFDLSLLPSLSSSASATSATTNDGEVPLSPQSELSSIILPTSSSSASLISTSLQSQLVSLDYIPTTIYNDQPIKIEKPWNQEDTNNNNNNTNNYNNNRTNTPPISTATTPQSLPPSATDTSILLQQLQKQYQFYPSPLPSPPQDFSLASPVPSITGTGIYPPSPCSTIEQTLQNFPIKQEFHILPPSPPESSGAPSPACSDIKSEPETDTEALIDIDSLLEKSLQSSQSLSSSPKSPLSPLQSSNQSSSQQQQQQQNNKKPVQDHQLLREYLQDTSFQKKHNLKPLALESLIGGLGVRGDIEPVISLALEYAKRDAQATCAFLKISPDPQQWTTSQVHAWIRSTIEQFKLPQIDNVEMKFPEDGSALICLTEEEFQRRIPEAGSTIHAQLEIWKLACSENFQTISSSTSIIDLTTPIGPSTSTTNWNSNNCSQNMDISDDEDEDMIPTSATKASIPSPPPPPSSSSSTSSVTTIENGITGTSTVVTATSATTNTVNTTGTTGTVNITKSGPGTRPGSSHIHLWQFLKELLSTPQIHGTAIRWLDRNKGVFKIEDSVRVAKLWGRRKNRPAMNYDKLSRSIRQYYKKGIMKKTERSQRLVYQFCHPYCL